MNCMNLKQKMDRTLYCKKQKKQITFKDCSGCPYIIYKDRSYTSLKAKKEYKYKPKKGKCSRYYNNISIMPKSPLYSTIPVKGCSKHHIFGNVANRPKSEEYGLFIWLTEEQHRYLHNHPLEMLQLKKTAQIVFMKTYNKSIDEFRKLLGRNYLK